MLSPLLRVRALLCECNEVRLSYWAEEVANEVFEWPRYREAIPEPLRGHVTLDLTSLALELEQYRHVVEGDEGVYVFNPDA